MVFQTGIVDISAVCVGNTECPDTASVGALPIVKLLGRKVQFFDPAVGAVINVIVNPRFFEDLRKHTVVSEGVDVVARLDGEAEMLPTEFL